MHFDKKRIQIKEQQIITRIALSIQLSRSRKRQTHTTPSTTTSAICFVYAAVAAADACMFASRTALFSFIFFFFFRFLYLSSLYSPHESLSTRTQGKHTTYARTHTNTPIFVKHAEIWIALWFDPFKHRYFIAVQFMKRENDNEPC